MIKIKLFCYLNAGVGDVGAAVDPELPDGVPGPADGEGQQAAVRDGRVGEREGGQPGTVGAEPPHTSVSQTYSQTPTVPVRSHSR